MIDTLSEQYRAAFETRLGELSEASAAHYARAMSVEDLVALDRFLDTPAGLKFAEIDVGRATRVLAGGRTHRARGRRSRIRPSPSIAVRRREVRLPPDYVAAIKAAAADAFGPGSVVRLFGSRTRDDLRGGDIDLHVEADALPDEWQAKSRFEALLFASVPPQKVDVVISQRGRPPQGFERIAYRDGIVL